ncbi:lipocalin family protein [Vibrio gangliei]|uniref:lipocalin family protein n=1 Tax=Vibrio gangliei TaxID=2077090 RepID=UPI000D01F3A3|nr:lipocalin family protein [Vibrio gangliei]
MKIALFNSKNLFIFIILFLTGCLGMPKSVTPIQPFDVNNYLGTWYEIARLDHSFERGLTHVTAEYSLKDDGGVKVINRGYSKQKQHWEQAEGKAYFVDETNKGYLKVSFFGPFYSSYVIFYLDPTGQYAFISGPDHDYLWLLSRTPTVDESVKQKFIDMSQQKGFDTSKLIFVDQQSPPKI